MEKCVKLLIYEFVVTCIKSHSGNHVKAVISSEGKSIDYNLLREDKIQNNIRLIPDREKAKKLTFNHVLPSTEYG